MTKFIISPGYGRGFIGEFKHRFDPILVDCLDKLSNLILIPPGPKHKNEIDEILNLFVARFYQFNINISKAYCSELRLIDLPSGKKFFIEEYDGSEYIITEKDLEYTVP